MREDSDILLLDGDCGLCNRLAIFIDKRKKMGKELSYLSIESEEGQKIINGFSTKQRDADSVYLIRNGKTYIRSAAGIRLLLYLKWYYAMWYPFCWLVPLPLRDIVYRIIARYRHKFFKKPEVCLFK
mgnify:FL=1|tara:strand:+ start:13424 stop:13804 length:381 start_codon:yes stop_codon:yes gene_type:complete